MTATTATLCDGCHKRASIRYHRTDDDAFNLCEHHARSSHTKLAGLGYTRQALTAMVSSG